jgi:hypothetical protein
LCFYIYCLAALRFIQGEVVYGSKREPRRMEVPLK